MEIKASDLRMGNYITDVWAEPGSMFSVLIIDSRKLYYGKPMPKRKGMVANYENIRGVLLTPEILLKAGFEKWGIWHRKDMLYVRHDIGFNRWFISIGKEYLIEHIQYIHQLQNLYFTLTSTELKIEL